MNPAPDSAGAVAFWASARFGGRRAAWLHRGETDSSAGASRSAIANHNPQPARNPSRPVATSDASSEAFAFALLAAANLVISTSVLAGHPRPSPRVSERRFSPAFHRRTGATPHRPCRRRMFRCRGTALDCGAVAAADSSMCERPTPAPRPTSVKGVVAPLGMLARHSIDVRGHRRAVAQTKSRRPPIQSSPSSGSRRHLAEPAGAPCRAIVFRLPCPPSRA